VACTARVHGACTVRVHTVHSLYYKSSACLLVSFLEKEHQLGLSKAGGFSPQLSGGCPMRLSTSRRPLGSSPARFGGGALSPGYPCQSRWRAFAALVPQKMEKRRIPMEQTETFDRQSSALPARSASCADMRTRRIAQCKAEGRGKDLSSPLAGR
jgi:hypothetical protein